MARRRRRRHYHPRPRRRNPLGEDLVVLIIGGIGGALAMYLYAKTVASSGTAQLPAATAGTATA